MTEYVRLALGLVLLLGIAVAVSVRAGLHRQRELVVAAVRAVLQLALVAAALRGVFAAPITSFAVVGVMFCVATWTAARRLRGGAADERTVLRAVLLSCFAGAAVVIAIIVALPTLDRDVRTFVAVSGIVLGGSMSGATLAGRHLNEGLRRRRDEIETWFSIGATPREAVRDIARSAASEALMPALDQTRTVGLVTLPGAFIGIARWRQRIRSGQVSDRGARRAALRAGDHGQHAYLPTWRAEDAADIGASRRRCN